MARLNRNKIFLVLASALVLLKLIPTLIFLIGSATTTGTVIDNETGKTSYHNSTQASPYLPGSKTTVKNSMPVAVYYVNDKEYTVNGPIYYENSGSDDVGSAVTIIYKKADPANAYFFTASGFWFSTYVYWLVALFIVFCATYSFIDDTQFLIVRYKQRSHGEKLVELTASEKEKSLKSWVRRSMVKPRRR